MADEVETFLGKVPGLGVVLGDDLSGADIEALVSLVMMAASKSEAEDLNDIMGRVRIINKMKERNRKAFERKLAASVASKIASALTAGAILATPECGLGAAHELGRWLEYVAKTHDGENDDD
jgi:hypothetical protein